MKTITKSQLNQWLKLQQNKNSKLKYGLLCGCLNGCLSVIQASLLAQLLYRLIHLGQSRDQLILFFIAFIAIVILKLITLWGREQLSYQGAAEIRTQVRAQLFEKIRNLGPAYIQTKSTGEWATMVFEQIEQLHDYYAKYVPQMTVAIFTPLLILAVLIPINWGIPLILICSVPLVPIIMAISGIKAGKANEQNLEALHRLSSQFYDRLIHLKTLKLFNRVDAETQQLYENSEDFRVKTMQVLRLAFISSAALEFFVSFSIAVVAIYFGFTLSGHWHWGTYGAEVSLATALFIFLLAPEFFQPLRDLGNFYHAKSTATASARSLMLFLSQTHSETKIDSIQNSDQKYSKIETDFSHITIEAIDLVILSASGKPLVGPLNFKIEPGEHVAFIGKSGSGKTSLIQAILGFLPYQGQLLINHIELAQIKPTLWHQQISWVDQNPFTLHATIEENISLSDQSNRAHLKTDLLKTEHSTLDLQREALKLTKVCEQAFVDEFLPLLPKGVNHIIKEDGVGLSLGQIQRICLARALYKEGNLWLLDEPTASLDAHSQALIEQSLKTASADKTMVIVTHKLQQAKQADRTLVISNGLIIDEITAEQWDNHEIQQRYFVDLDEEIVDISLQNSIKDKKE